MSQRVILALSALTAYHKQTEQEHAHVARARPAQAQVVTYTDGDFRQVFEVRDGPRAGSKVRIEVVEELEPGTLSTILLDPTDATWARLVGEPKGYTFWFGWALLGALLALWSGVHLIARTRAGHGDQESAVHRVQLAPDGRAEVTLGRDTHPVATVRLGTVEPLPSSGSRTLPVLVRGPLADGGWVSLTSEDGALPVVGPVEAVQRWRDIGTGTGALDRRLGATIERARRVGATLGQIGLLVLGGFFMWLALDQVGPAWKAAQGRGVPGQLTVTSESCSKGCDYAGNFRSEDGRYTFTDVALIGASGPIGSQVPALYEGDGETPDAVYGHGWGGVAESGFFLGAALLAIGRPLLRALQIVCGRLRPPGGRHSRPNR
jgi:hypothetical protein